MSTYLKYNNHMILHPTDSSKYIYGIVEEHPTPPFDEVTIGSQTWKSKNLAIYDGQGGIYAKTVNYGQGDVVEHYYTWDAAVRVAATVQGWHLPTASEWDALAKAVGGSNIAGTKLKSTTGWSDNSNGTDDFGFAAFPAGYWRSHSFKSLGDHAYFWTASEISSTKAYSRLFYWGESMDWDAISKSDYCYSVRLIKD